jgi:hypothetical protein
MLLLRRSYSQPCRLRKCLGGGCQVGFSFTSPIPSATLLTRMHLMKLMEMNEEDDPEPDRDDVDVWYEDEVDVEKE